MIDPLHLFPNFDSEREASSVKPSSGMPVSSELKKEIPTFAIGGSYKSVQITNPEVRPSPMEMMRDRDSQLVDPEVQEELDSEELQEQINYLKQRLWDAQTLLEERDPSLLADEHREAMGVIIDLVEGDLRAIARETHQEVMQPKLTEDKSVTRRVIDWVSSGEEILNRALLYFSDRDGQSENFVDFLKVQYAVQRATQRAELFASIVGTTVSSIKTIMTTQLG